MKVMPGYVLIEPIQEENINGFIVTESNVEKQLKGKVIGVGSETINEWGTKISTEIKEGDIVAYRHYGHDDFNFEGKDYKICRFLDITLKIND